MNKVTPVPGYIIIKFKNIKRRPKIKKIKEREDPKNFQGEKTDCLQRIKQKKA